MALNRNNNIPVKRTLVKRRNQRCSCDGYKYIWSYLPLDIIERIVKHLRLEDIVLYIMGSGRWSSNTKDLFGFQPPHVVVLSVLACIHLQLENVFGGSTFHARLPRFVGRRCYGFTSGYLLLEDRKHLDGVWLVNPLTRSKYELHFTIVSPHCVLIGTAEMDPSVAIIIAISNTGSRAGSPLRSLVKQSVLQVYWYNMPHSRRMFRSTIVPAVCLDAAIFNRKLYVITDEGQTGLMKVSCPDMELSIIENMPRIQFLSTSPRLVVSGENLILVDFVNANQFKIYELDLPKMIWQRVFSLGSRALFISDSTSHGIRETRHWGGKSNCIYSIGQDTSRCECYTFDGRLVESYPVGERMRATLSGMAKPMWYFPDVAWDVAPLSIASSE